MDARDTIARYCVMHGAVGEMAFGHSLAADCFCGRGGLPPDWGHRTDEGIIEFVEEAIVKAVAKKSGMRKRDVRASIARRRATVAP